MRKLLVLELWGSDARQVNFSEEYIMKSIDSRALERRGPASQFQ